jgi:3-oxoacyl-[acyl-carrier-protein] synthase-3
MRYRIRQIWEFQFIQKKFTTDHQVFNNIQKYGNTTEASIPMLQTEAGKRKNKTGDTVILAFGSGFT